MCIALSNEQATKLKINFNHLWFQSLVLVDIELNNVPRHLCCCFLFVIYLCSREMDCHFNGAFYEIVSSCVWWALSGSREKYDYQVNNTNHFHMVAVQKHFCQLQTPTFRACRRVHDALFLQMYSVLFIHPKTTNSEVRRLFSFLYRPCTILSLRFRFHLLE